MVRRLVLALSWLAAAPAIAPARADSRGVTVVNSGPETIRRIEVGTPDNRLLSSVPPGAQARITFSTGCTADVRIGYDTGRLENFPGVDICSDPRVVTGQGVQAGTYNAAADGAARPAANGKPGAVTAAPLPPKAVVPPWTGKSITKRFGGMD